MAGGGGGGSSSNGHDANPPEPGHGGNGMVSTILAGLNNISIPNRFAAGGGGTGKNSSANPINPALGGSVDGVKLGGDGNNNITGSGGRGLVNTGSGGGAGVASGGAGATGLVVLRVSFGALPVDYKYFNTAYHEFERKIHLRWATSKEWENSHFEIERSVNNVSNWEKIGLIAGKGWSDVVTDYLFEDTNVMAEGGNYYYRLRQVDFNLEYEYSKTVMVNVPNANRSTAWSAFPNPIYDGDLISLISKNPLNDSEVNVRIISSQSTISVFSASTQLEINEKLRHSVFSLPKGLFLIEVTVGNKIDYIKIFKR